MAILGFWTGHVISVFQPPFQGVFFCDCGKGLGARKLSPSRMTRYAPCLRRSRVVAPRSRLGKACPHSEKSTFEVTMVAARS